MGTCSSVNGIRFLERLLINTPGVGSGCGNQTLHRRRKRMHMQAISPPRGHRNSPSRPRHTHLYCTCTHAAPPRCPGRAEVPAFPLRPESSVPEAREALGSPRGLGPTLIETHGRALLRRLVLSRLQRECSPPALACGSANAEGSSYHHHASLPLPSLSAHTHAFHIAYRPHVHCIFSFTTHGAFFAPATAAIDL